ncbi:MAG: FGGY family carbohydrate kinase [Candidatus Marinamargulisbacteria bacterium]
MGKILAIDSGTTSTRVIAFNDQFDIDHIEQAELPLFHPQPDWVEQDPGTIWQLTKQCLDATIGTIGVQNIDAIGITNQRETSIAWQKSTHKPLGPAINWQCRRTANRCNELKPHSTAIKQKTGLPLDAYFSASKFEWHSQHTPSVNALIEQNDLCFGTVDAWLLWNLTNGESFKTDVTNASRTMLFNIQTLAYDPDLCNLFGVPMTALPQVEHSHTHFGDYTIDNVRIPIQGMIGDQQAALYAQCGQNQGQIKNTYGTGLFMMANTGSSIVQTNDLISTIAIGMNGQVDYAIEGAVFTGGSLIQWLRDGLGMIQSAPETQTLAESVPTNGGVTIIPALTGLGAPHWNPDAKGMIMGLTRQTTKAHIARAALEAIALQSNDIIELIRKECPNIAFNTLLVDGGASANDWLMQCQADVSQLNVSRPPSVEATALGAALCAAKHTNPSINATKGAGDTFMPMSKPDALKNHWRIALANF